MKYLRLLVALSVFGAIYSGLPAVAQGPLPKFEFQGITLHPKDLRYSPSDDLIHLTIVKTEGPSPIQGRNCRRLAKSVELGEHNELACDAS